MKAKAITLNVNGRRHQVTLFPNVTLLEALRDLSYTDVKNGCEKGDCGACAVELNGFWRPQISPAGRQVGRMPVEPARISPLPLPR